MKRKIYGAIAACIMLGTLAVPVHAGNSYLDIKANDIYSYPETKDDSERNFYITPKTYVGDYVRVRSRCLDNAAYASGYLTVSKTLNKSKPYSYGRPVNGGLTYQLDGYGAPGNTWHLVGTYCP